MFATLDAGEARRFPEKEGCSGPGDKMQQATLKVSPITR
jgi:hypothetical protein